MEKYDTSVPAVGYCTNFQSRNYFQVDRALSFLLIIANLVHFMKTTREEAVTFQIVVTDKTDDQIIFVKRQKLYE